MILCVCQCLFVFVPHLLLHIGIHWGTLENTWALMLRGSDLVYLRWELLCVCALQVSPVTLKSSPGSGLIPQWSVCLFPTPILGVPVRGTKHICALTWGSACWPHTAHPCFCLLTWLG